MLLRHVKNPGLLVFWRLPLAVAIFILALDQWTKHLVIRNWAVGEQVVVIPGFFNLVHFRNPGAAWGMLGGYTWALTILSFVALAALVWRFDQLVQGRLERALALGAVAGGIVGNLVDRIAYGEVVDFLLFYWHAYHWPAFNVADSAISCGVAVFLLSSFLDADPPGEHEGAP